MTKQPDSGRTYKMFFLLLILNRMHKIHKLIVQLSDCMCEQDNQCKMFVACCFDTFLAHTVNKKSILKSLVYNLQDRLYMHQVKSNQVFQQKFQGDWKKLKKKNKKKK